MKLNIFFCKYISFNTRLRNKLIQNISLMYVQDVTIRLRNIKFSINSRLKIKIS